MSASFELFVLHLQGLLKVTIIGNAEKAMITDIFWSRFSKETKDAYKRETLEYNTFYCLRGRQKMNAFWYFASEIIREMRNERLTPSYIETLFDGLKEEAKKEFTLMNNDFCARRQIRMLTILRNDAPFLI